MHISEFSIRNYKCFHNTDFIKLKPGINIIVGKNNSGKTALLEALNLNFKNVPHQSLKVLPNKDNKTKNNISRLELTLSIDRNEFNHCLDEIPEPLAIPFPCVKESFNFLKEALEKIEKEELAGCNRKEFYTEALEHLDAQDFYGSDMVGDPNSNSFILRADATFKKFNEFLSQDNEPIKLTLSISDNSQLIEDGKGSKRFNFNIYEPQHNKEITFVKVSKGGNDILKINPLFIDVLHPDGSVDFSCYSTFLGEYKESIAYKIFNLHRNRIYRFYAQRPQIGNCSFGDNVELKPDASNLAEVLSCLQSNRKKFDEFNNYANEIFPLIKWISVVNRKGKFEILVWNVEQSTQREDLAVPLEYCGTGICQVLAILYILVTSQNSRTIIIDEPQAFLHPGATKDLMAILELFPQHQYFITTHSPAIIAASKTCNIIQLEYDEKEYKTNISVIDSQNMQSMYSLLSKIGVKLSDVFGADYILWVEGATEELCFPLIVENILDKSLLGTQIIGVQHTSDFEGKLSRTVFEIYERLSTGKGLLPPAIGFIFDRENRTQQNINDLQRQSKGIVKFLSRVMYENYLLNLDAIIYVISESNLSIEKEITPQDIERWLKDNGNHRNYFPKGEAPIDFENPQWIEKVHGANILKGVFNDLSETRVAYDKVIHGELLTKWIIENSPSDLSEVSGLIDSILASGR